jgi:hypothetical protein
LVIRPLPFVKGCYNKSMTSYTHLELNKDVPTPSGYYNPLKEVKINLDGRDILYTVNNAVIESSCCGANEYASATVPGYILGWHAEKTESGMPVTLVEPRRDEKARQAIRKLIRNNENIALTDFW